MLLDGAVIDEEPRVDPAPGLEPVPRVPAPDPPPPRDHLPPVRVAPEQFYNIRRPWPTMTTIMMCFPYREWTPGTPHNSRVNLDQQGKSILD